MTESISPTPILRPELASATSRKVRRRLLPIIGVLYFIAFLDRNNVSFGKLEMSGDIGLTSVAYGFGAGLFFVGYALFEIPSNAGMYRYGARFWIARIMVSWGVAACAMAFVTGPVSFGIVRLLLGIAEAGFFPAILFYLTLWFPARERVTVLGLFVLAQPISNAIGAPLSGLLLGLDGLLGIHSWQWLFLLEGVPAILLGFLVPRLLTDRPEDAGWLSTQERRCLTATMAADAASRPAAGRERFTDGLRDRRALAYAALNFGMVCGIYGFRLWLPTIVDALGSFSSTQLGFIVMIPYAFAAGFMHWWAKRADRTGRRARHAAASMVLAASGLLGTALTAGWSAPVALLCLIVAACGVYAGTAPLLAMPSAAFTGAAAAAGLALVNGVGNLGGFVAPYLVGLLNEVTGNDRLSLVFLAGVLLVTAVATFWYADRRPEGSVRLTAPTEHTNEFQEEHHASTVRSDR
ncbi:MFS transporter [Flexivirga sp. ID2601S]|uniref:MFS transporter n=1 Tax=Flexivirga aerilata TaxID=1656889 RepID=A0A849ARH6_9MICO|nr:MFS transporter [Flexivirga aerilata]NNG40880.1 MFS transporter [Flexivirga aerilata]